MWGNNDACNGEINKLYVDCNIDGHHEDTKSSKGNEIYNTFTPKKRKERVRKISRFMENMFETGYLLPDYGLGCTAHITLGVVDGCAMVKSRDDLREIVFAELDQRPKSEYTFDNEMIRMYHENLWVVYFRDSLYVPSMFCGSFYSQRADAS